VNGLSLYVLLVASLCVLPVIAKILQENLLEAVQQGNSMSHFTFLNAAHRGEKMICIVAGYGF
jgi:hypothetical protein